MLSEVNDLPRPLVSVLLATRNEEFFIAQALTSLLQQRSSTFDLEILIIDGLSTDRTLLKAAEVARMDHRVRVIQNPAREIPFAWNLGLQASAGKYVCTFGAHCLYEPDYIEVCLEELITKGVVACSGRVISAPSRDLFHARLCSWILGHPFGSSSRSFRTQCEGFVDSPAYPIFIKSAIVDVGGYDEDLLRNEDNDMSRKLQDAGGKLYCTWKTKCHYFGKDRLSDLLRYAFRNGLWNAIGLRKNWRTMRVRHFVPFAFVLVLLVLMLVHLSSFPYAREALMGMVGLICMHLGVGFLAGLQIAVREKSSASLSLPPLFLIFHIAYGVGTLFGFCKIVRTITQTQARDIGREPVA